MSNTITGKAIAWITGGYRIPSDPNELIETLGYAHPDQDMSGCGWVHYGEAEITITLRDRAEVVTEQIEQLRKQQNDILAKAEAESTRISQQIQNLLAITYEAEQEAAEAYQMQRDRMATS